MDSDDIALENRLETQVEFMERNKNIDVCGMYAQCFGKRKLKKYIHFTKCEEIMIQNLYMSVIIHPTVIIRKESLIKNNYLYNENYYCAQDFELWSRMIKKDNFAIIKKVGIKYRIHEGQASVSKNEMQNKFTKEIIKENTKKIDNKFNEDNYKCLLMLGNKLEVNIDNYIEFSNLIDNLITTNCNFNQKKLKKLLYNRYFHILLKNKILFRKFVKIMCNFKILKKVLRLYNIRYIIKYLFINLF